MSDFNEERSTHKLVCPPGALIPSSIQYKHVGMDVPILDRLAALAEEQGMTIVEVDDRELAMISQNLDILGVVGFDVLLSAPGCTYDASWQMQSTGYDSVTLDSLASFFDQKKRSEENSQRVGANVGNAFDKLLNKTRVESSDDSIDPEGPTAEAETDEV